MTRIEEERRTMTISIRTLHSAVMVICIAVVVLSSPAFAEAPYEVTWARQLGTSGWDEGMSVAVDSNGNAYICGYTDGSLDGNNAGLGDSFLAKYDSSGTWLWTRQLGTSADEYSTSVAVDSNGNAYISGETYGSLDGNSAGGVDAFLAKYDGSGALLWTRQLGTSGNDSSASVAVDSVGNAYISGWTDGSLDGNNAGGNDAFVTKYDSSGVWQWTRQLGSSSWDRSESVAVDSNGNAYITGWTDGSLDGNSAGQQDIFLAKYNSSGVWQWTRQLGTSASDYSYSVAVDSADNAYISGYTRGSLDGNSAGSADAFLAKYDSSGVWLWTRQLGTTSNDYGTSVAVDSADNAYISGDTYGSLDGTNVGARDVYLAKYNSSGDWLWTRQFGTSAEDYSTSMAVDSAGNAYICGYTEGSLDGNNAGFEDAFLVKYEPTTMSLTVIGGGGSGNYAPGEVVSISAAAAPEHRYFFQWTGDTGNVSDVNDPNTTITMPIADASVTATYTQPGDVNRDGVVDIVDLNMILIDWGKSAGPL